MLDMKRREFIALVGGGGLLLAAKARRARALGASHCRADRWAGSTYNRRRNHETVW
jgi:hypothetical protein